MEDDINSHHEGDLQIVYGFLAAERPAARTHARNFLQDSRVVDGLRSPKVPKLVVKLRVAGRDYDQLRDVSPKQVRAALQYEAQTCAAEFISITTTRQSQS